MDGQMTADVCRCATFWLPVPSPPWITCYLRSRVSLWMKREPVKWSFLLLQVNIFISLIKSPNLGLTEISRVRKMHSVLDPLLWSAILIKDCYKIVSRFYLNNFHKSSHVVCFSRNGWTCWCDSWKLLCILHFLFQSCICIVCNSLSIQEL